MVRILYQQVVVRDGWHNLLTDISYWKGYYWLGYSRRSGHYAADGCIIILKSLDLKRWHHVTVINTVGHDWCPKFCSTNNRLLVNWFTSYPMHQRRNVVGEHLDNTIVDHDSHVCYTEDGMNWSIPVSMWKNQNMWSLRVYDGKFYSAAWGWAGDPHDHVHGPVDLLQSDDGLHWQKVSTITEVKDRLDETDLWFMPDDELWAVSAGWRLPLQHSVFSCSRPPYTEWEQFDLKASIASPVICECDGKYYVAGRKDSEGYMPEPWLGRQMSSAGSTTIHRLERGKVDPIFALPSDGDVWQPGMISTQPGQLIVSYNSQHAYMSGAVRSKLPVPFSYHRPEIYLGDNDIYIAELDLEEID